MICRRLSVALTALLPACLMAPDERASSATVAAYDLRAADRAACNVGPGQRTSDTIGPSVPHGDQLPFEHVVLLMLENRSFDHYFRGLAQGPTVVDGVPMQNYAGQIDVAGCDAARGHSVTEAHDCRGTTETDFNVDPWTNTKVHQFHESRYCTVDTAHNWEHVHRQYNLATSDGHADGLMDGFVASNNVYGPGGGGGRAMGYYDARDLPYYYWLANTFSISDRHFSSLLGPTWPNRYYYLSGTSFGRTRTPDYPVRGGDNLIELLRRNNRSVEVYRDGAVSFSAGAYADSSYVGKSMWRSQNQVGTGDDTWEALVARNALPAVSILDPSFSNAPWPANDEHPPHNVQLGQNLVARVVGALTSNLEVWRKTVLIITYDEHGGYYDHVEPPTACTPDDDPANAEFDRLGPRVPLYVISPWTKPHYVSHSVTDHTSVMRFVENRFDLPALTRRDAAAWPMLDMFDFENPPFWTPPQQPMQLAQVDQAPKDWCANNAPGNGVDPAAAAEAGVTPVPASPPSQCIDAAGNTVTPQQGEREPNDGLHQLQHVGDVSDLNWAGLGWEDLDGTLAGSDDTDLFHWNAIDHVYAYNNPTLRLVEAPAGVHACIFLACKSGTTIQSGGEDAEAQQSIDDEYCDGGTAKWAASGTIKGCCVSPGETTAVRGYDCLGLRDDDSADLVIKVYADAPQSAEEARVAAERAQMCLPYEVRFHF